MNTPFFQDRRTTSLLNRVREDVNHLRADIGNLLSDTTTRTLPNTAHELADRAKQQFAAGSAYAASRLRGLGSTPRQSAPWIGGAVVLGLIAFGAYAFCQKNCESRQAAGHADDESGDEHDV